MEPIAHGSSRTLHVCCWPECFALVEHPDLPLCESHLREVGMAWVRDNLDVLREVVEATPEHVVLARARNSAEDLHQSPHRPVSSLVYYLDLGDRVKIGTTTNLPQRLASLRLDRSAVLATEPGGYDVERHRHQEFTEERFGRREDFARSDRLMGHIASLT